MAEVNGSSGESEAASPDVIRLLRKRTKEVHTVSGLLVNAKFAFALSDESVWTDGLLAFYEIYKYLEENLPEELCPREFHRTAAFEKDLAYFLGADWKKDYEPRESVKRYLKHMEAVKAEDEKLLLAYVYQMYAALISGGQLLQKKRMIARKLWVGRQDDDYEEDEKLNGSNDDDDVLRNPKKVAICPPGCNATFFPGKLFELRTKLRKLVNETYANFDDATKEKFIEENCQVFLNNNEILQSIKNVNRVNLRKLGIGLAIIVSVYLAIKLVRY